MSVASALAQGRRAAERLMVDQCTVSRGGEPVFNPETGQYDTTSGAAAYSGKCRIQSGTTQASNPEAGGAVFTVERVELQVPFGTVFQIGDIATITVSENPALVGNKYRVTGLGEKTHATKQAFNVEVVT